MVPFSIQLHIFKWELFCISCIDFIVKGGQTWIIIFMYVCWSKFISALSVGLCVNFGGLGCVVL